MAAAEKSGLALNLSGVTKRFGGLTAVDGVTLQLPMGALYGLIGPNGAGKTTVFNLITGVYPVTAGFVEVLGERVSDAHRTLPVDHIANRGICRTFQSSRLFKEMTCLDNIKVASHKKVPYHSWEAFFFSSRFCAEEKAIHDEAMNLLAIFELKQYAEHTAGSLPYGAQRRLEIARALATGAKVLLLDEPAAGMNHKETDELQNWVLKIRREFQLSILLIEHDMKFVMNLCEHISVLDHGCLIAQGTPKQIQSNPKVIEAYLGASDIHDLEAHP